MSLLPWVEGRSYSEGKRGKQSRALVRFAFGWVGVPDGQNPQETRITVVVASLPSAQCFAGFQGRFYSLWNLSRTPEMQSILLNLERLLYLPCLLDPASVNCRTHSFINNFNENLLCAKHCSSSWEFCRESDGKDPCHFITDHLFYSGWEKDNKCVKNKWLYMYLLVINDMNKT